MRSEAEKPLTLWPEFLPTATQPMFDIGFSEMLLIALVALIVIGPERLPKVTRTIGHLLGRMQRYVDDVKAEVEREMRIEELKSLQASVEDQARSLERSVATEAQDAEQSLRRVAEDPWPAAPEPVAKETPAAQLELGLGESPGPPQKSV